MTAIKILYNNKEYDLSEKLGIKQLKEDSKLAIEKKDFFYLTEIKNQLDRLRRKKNLDSSTRGFRDDLLKIIDEFLEEEDEDFIKGDFIRSKYLFPRSEYYTRFKGSTAFLMKDPAHRGTYHRSESTRSFRELGGRINVEFASPCTEKPIKANSFFAHTGGIASPFSHKKYKKTIKLSVKAPKSKTNFRDLALIYKKKMAEQVVKSFEKQTENTHSLRVGRKIYTRPIVLTENDYPCVLISFPSLSPAETKTEAAKYWSKHPKPFQKLLLAAFVAFLNEEAYQAKIPIEMVIRASFGHNLPSICETDKTFRINVGLIPKAYAKLVGKTLAKLNEVINDLSDECTTRPGFDNVFQAKVKKYNAKKLKKCIDEKKRYEKLRGTRDYKKAENSNKAFERLYDKFLSLNKNKPRKGSAIFSPVRLTQHNVWEVIRAVGDSANRSVLAECFREHETVDLFASMVFEEIQDTDNHQKAIEKALKKLLSYLDFNDTVTMNYKKMRSDLRPNAKYIFKEMSFAESYQNDPAFDHITQLLFDGFGTERPSENIYSAIDKAGAMFFARARGSSNVSKEADNGSSSEFSDDLTDSNNSSDSDEENSGTLHFFHKKLRVCSGMKSIVLAHYGAMSYLRKKGCKKVQLDSEQMYYEVENALKMVRDTKAAINSIRGRLSNASILHFDLNHCNASNSPDNVSLRRKLKEVEPKVVILDYTSSTMDKVNEALRDCLLNNNIDVVIFVESGLKNNQGGQETNPYGEVRVVARSRAACNSIIDTMELGLAEEDKLPQQAHELVRACKNRGFAPSFFGFFKTNEKRFQVVDETYVFQNKK